MIIQKRKPLHRRIARSARQYSLRHHALLVDNEWRFHGFESAIRLMVNSI